MVNIAKLVITKKASEYAELIAKDLQKAIGLKEHWTSIRSYLEPGPKLRCLKQVENALKINITNEKVLEIGSGMGLFLVVCRLNGIDVRGIEPCANSYKHLHQGIRELLRENLMPDDVISFQKSKHLPWDDNTFDIVVSFQVLEHVQDPRQTLLEAIRVLKPGGKLYMDMPNYFSFVEGHYGLIWFPFLAFSKDIAKFYVSLFHRNPCFLDELNFVTSWRLKKWTRGINAVFSFHNTDIAERDYSPGTERTVDVLLPDGFQWRAGKRFGKVAGMIKDFISLRNSQKVLSKFGLSNHIILIAEKTNSHSL